jgi:hypothetical protein
MNNPTEDEARAASGDELNRLVELYYFDDDLSCFNEDGKERRERIVEAVYSWYWEFDSEEDRLLRQALLSDMHKANTSKLQREKWTLHSWDNRHGKPFQSDLESHVNRYQAKPRGFEGDMNLSIHLLNPDLRMGLFQEGSSHWSVWGTWCESLIALGDLDKPSQAICRAAVILAIRGARNE